MTNKRKCERCGKRLKFKPGGTMLPGLNHRYTTCRACGHDQSWAERPEQQPVVLVAQPGRVWNGREWE
jgi:hypothetical protein